jgi:hypothetical protein
MELFYRITLFLAGIINLLPSLLAFLPNKIFKSYGVTVPDGNYELLLRHRAVLFGIIGGLMIFSAVTKKLYMAATLSGFVSMASFILLFFIIDKSINAELRKVMLIDVIAMVILVVGFVAFMLTSTNLKK